VTYFANMLFVDAVLTLVLIIAHVSMFMPTSLRHAFCIQ